MSVVVSDLVARFRADTTDLQRGSAEVKQQLQAVTDQAATASRALEIMAGQFAKIHGGTAAEALSMFQRTGVQPTQAALSEAARQMEAVGTAAQKATAPATNLARSAAEHASSMRVAAASHAEVGNSVRLSETSMVRFGAALAGVNIGLSIAAGAGRLLHQNLADSLEAAVQLDRVSRGLTASYGAAAPQLSAFAQRIAPTAGITTTGAERALTAAAPLTQYGLSTAQVQQLTARSADIAGRYGQPFDQVFGNVLQAVQGGGNELQQYGLRLDDARVKTEAYGGALSSTFDRMTASQQIGVRFNLFLQQTRDLQGSAATAAGTLSGSLDRLGAAFDRLREKSGTLVSGGVQGPADAAAMVINSLTGADASSGQRPIIADPRAPGGARIITGPQQYDFSSVPGLGPAPAPPSFIGPIPLRGADLFNAQAQNAQDLAGRSQAEAQAQITAIQLQSEQRRLNVAQELAGYRQDELQAQGDLAPLLERQANLQDKITIASRDNLETRRALIAAEQAALPSANALSGLDYQQQRLVLRADASRASVLRGGGPTEDIAGLRQQYYSLDLERPDLQLQDLDARHAIDLVQQRQTGQDLGRQGQLTDLEAQRRALEDQTIPLQEQARLAQEREASVQRTLELADLANTKTLVAAQQALQEANTVKLLADETARLAQDYSDHMVTGATALERAASAAQATRDALAQTFPFVQSFTPESSRRITNGLGAGGLGPAAGGLTMVFSIPTGDASGIRQRVNEALDEYFSGWVTSGAPAPSTVSGAGR